MAVLTLAALMYSLRSTELAQLMSGAVLCRFDRPVSQSVFTQSQTVVCQSLLTARASATKAAINALSYTLRGAQVAV